MSFHISFFQNPIFILLERNKLIEFPVNIPDEMVQPDVILPVFELHNVVDAAKVPYNFKPLDILCMGSIESAGGAKSWNGNLETSIIAA